MNEVLTHISTYLCISYHQSPMLSQKARYAIKALVYLAQQPEGEPVRTMDISEKNNLPKKFLEIILLDLKREGLVGSKMGSHGGYYLQKNATDINLAEIYRLFDGAIALVPCASEKFFEPCEDCQDLACCPLRISMMQVRKQTFQALESISIASMLTQGSGPC